MYQIGDVVQIRRTQGLTIKATIFKINETAIEVKWHENGQLVGKKVYFKDIIKQNVRNNHINRNLCMSLFVFIILIIFFTGVIHNFNKSNRVFFLTE